MNLWASLSDWLDSCLLLIGPNTTSFKGGVSVLGLRIISSLTLCQICQILSGLELLV